MKSGADAPLVMIWLIFFYLFAIAEFEYRHVNVSASASPVAGKLLFFWNIFTLSTQVSL